MSMEDQINLIYKNFLNSEGISTDSRKIKKNSIFFSLKGENFDGNKFANEALDKGALYSVVDDKNVFNASKNLILVDNCLNALHNLAKLHRSKFDIPVVGITGSNGKTTTKNLLYHVLSSKFKVYATKGNLNNHIGVPLSILEMDDSYEIAIIEMGASAVGEIQELSSICNPSVGLITNISSSHIKGFENFDGVIRGKSELFDYLIKNHGKVFINNNDLVINNFAKRFKDPIFLFGDNSFVKSSLISSVPNVTFEISNSQKFTSNLMGSHNYENIVFALSIGKYFGISEENAAKEISKFSPHDNRSQLIRFNSNTIILDAYNANPVSMKHALETLSKFDKYKIAILGDMLELGKISKTEHEGIGLFVSNLKLDQVYYVGSRMKNAYLTDKNSLWFNNKSDLESELNKIQIKDSVVLLKGSRSLMLESLVPLIKKISA
jgi:UDP-N-acetylmuramoyl-tripeptide--D-alanyl-D-alanine ligase